MEEGRLAQLKALLRLAAPNSFTYLINMAIPLISTLFLGRIGEAELGAALLGNMLANATGLAVGLGLSMALDTLCSQAFGAQHYRLVGLHCQRGMAILTVACLPILAIWSQTERILTLLGVEASVAALASVWVWRLMLGLWPWLMVECFRRFLLSQNITWITTVSLIAVVAMHIFNTWLLSLRLGWGISGAAIAVSIANWLLLLLAMFLFFCRTSYLSYRSAPSYELARTASPQPVAGTPPRSASPMPLHSSSSTGSLQDLSSPQDSTFMTAAVTAPAASFDTWPPLSIDIFRGWNDYLKLGIPASSSMLLEWGAYEIYSAIAAHIPGTVPLATHAILVSTAGLWYMAPLGLATACSTLVGNSLGAGNPDRAQRFAALGVLVVMIFGVVNGGAGLLYRNAWGKVWSPDETVQRMVAEMMPYMALYSFVDVIKCVGTAVLRGTGRPMVTLIGNAISSLVVGYPCAFFLVFYCRFSLAGLWTAMALGWLCAGAIYCVVLLRTDWEEEAQAAARRNESALETLSSVVSVVDAAYE